MGLYRYYHGRVSTLLPCSLILPDSLFFSHHVNRKTHTHSGKAERRGAWVFLACQAESDDGPSREVSGDMEW